MAAAGRRPSRNTSLQTIVQSVIVDASEFRESEVDKWITYETDRKR
jgi:hypothetical protein